MTKFEPVRVISSSTGKPVEAISPSTGKPVTIHLGRFR